MYLWFLFYLLPPKVLLGRCTGGKEQTEASEVYGVGHVSPSPSHGLSGACDNGGAKLWLELELGVGPCVHTHAGNEGRRRKGSFLSLIASPLATRLEGSPPPLPDPLPPKSQSAVQSRS